MGATLDASGRLPLGDLDWQNLPASEFSSVALAWDSISRSRSVKTPPFLRSDFIAPLLREFGTGRERVLLAFEGGRPVAGAILSQTRLGVWSTFQPSQLPLGPVVTAPGVAIEAVAEAMIRALPGLVLHLGLTQLDPLIHPRPEDGPRCRSLDYIETAWMEVAGDFATYWAGRGKNLRKGLAKQRRNLEADGTALQLEVLTRPDDVLSGLHDLAVLEGSGWKAAQGTAIRMEDAQGRFYADMLKAFAETGEARVYRYRFNGKPVAVDLCIEAGLVQVVLKTAYDEKIEHYSPAFLMREELLQREWSEGRISRIEFYGRRMEWHERWTERARVLYHLNVYRLPMLAELHARRSRLAQP